MTRRAVLAEASMAVVPAAVAPGLRPNGRPSMPDEWIEVRLGENIYYVSDVPGESRNHPGENRQLLLWQIQDRNPKNLQVTLMGGEKREIYWEDWPRLMELTGTVVR